ncbi:hypothetical protein KIW84_065178 [Lathyrus oleraceus]|uniref:Uncharacterized protein n=1 Tax=Pisum sativum TaxID=3888 RepID=A0A9D4WC83_PEA|nr:hypothetical protein KIW84_065178 [Pisum sativum]
MPLDGLTSASKHTTTHTEGLKTKGVEKEKGRPERSAHLLPTYLIWPGLPDYMKIERYTSMQIAYQAKQSKVHKELKATKVPEISQAQLVYKSKLNQNETKANSQHKQINVQCTSKKSYQGKNESNAVYGQRSHNTKNSDHAVGAVTIAAPPAQNFQHRQDRPRRQFTKINMTLAQALQSMLKANLITLRGPPANVNTTSPRYNPNARCAYHSDSPGHDTNDCWLLKNKIQDMIDAGEIEFEPPETPNVITAPMPNHDKAVNVVDDNSHITTVADLTSSLLIIKKNLLQAGLFPGCAESCDLCILRPKDCLKLRNGIQRLIDDRTILFERIPKAENTVEEISVIARSKVPVKIIATRVPVKITVGPKVAPLIITAPGPVPYSSSKAIPWNYGGDVYIHGIKQVGNSANPNDIVGTSKVTRSGRIFSPEISPPAPETRGKEPAVNPSQSETPVEVTTEDIAK